MTKKERILFYVSIGCSLFAIALGALQLVLQ